MKILSLNCRGLASPAKKSSLKRLVSVNNPDIIFLQETMGVNEVVVRRDDLI
jgi:exonuclease III